MQEARQQYEQHQVSSTSISFDRETCYLHNDHLSTKTIKRKIIEMKHKIKKKNPFILKIHLKRISSNNNLSTPFQINVRFKISMNYLLRNQIYLTHFSGVFWKINSKQLKEMKQGRRKNTSNNLLPFLKPACQANP